jgi:hypothetical protein
VVSLAGMHKYAKARTSLHSEYYRLSDMLIIDKICMRLAASDAPAALKLRVVKPVNKVNIQNRVEY